MKNKVGLIAMMSHYDGEINKICNDVEFRRSIGLKDSNDITASNNEKLYRLIQYKNNLIEILEKLLLTPQPLMG